MCSYCGFWTFGQLFQSPSYIQTIFMAALGIQPRNGFGMSKNIRMGFNTEIRNEKSYDPAVVVENGFKRYGNDFPVLNNFNMNVQKGTVYGLLGASGCGKTTLLSCIVGLRKLDSGSINVFGVPPGSRESGKTIGYMPQELGLYQIFTVKEVLRYFGKIYGMTATEVQARITFLSTFLDLPKSTRLISTLSGGQQRRVSLAVAMIHEPELLILDEPTVGVDPLIRESIWEHLSEIVAKRKTTVIITTHYIEEARQAQMIGLMRNGRLLTERPPLTLLEEHNTVLLEDIVLELCRKDSLSSDTSNYAKDVNPSSSNVSFYSRNKRVNSEGPNPVLGLTYKSRSSDDDVILCKAPRQDVEQMRKAIDTKYFGLDIWSHANKIGALAIRNILTLLRYPAFLAVTIINPTLTIILFNLVVGKESKHLSLGVINHEFQSLTYLEECRTFPVGCFNDRLSCHFLNTFPQDEIKWVAFLSEKDGLESVKRGNTWGYISIPANFTKNLKDRYVLRKFAKNETIVGSEIKIRLDMSANIQGNFLRSGLYKYYAAFLKDIVLNCGGDTRSVGTPLRFNSVYGSSSESFLEFVMPAQILIIIFATPMASALSFIWDKKAGTLDRNLVAGVKIVHVFLALVISEGLIIISALLMSFGVLIFVVDFKIKGSIVLAFLLCFLQGMTGLSFGFVFGTLCNHEREVMICIIGMFLPVFFSSGANWPLEGLEVWIRTIFLTLPATLSIETLRSIVSRGMGFLDSPHVWMGFLSLTCWTVICCVLSGIIHRIRN